MKVLLDLFQIAITVALFATAIFHPLCVIAMMSMAIAYHLNAIKARLVAVAAAILTRRSPK